MSNEKSMKDYENELEHSFQVLREGDILDVTVIGISDTEVTVDLNYYTEGIIPIEECSDDPSFSIKKDMVIGDTIKAMVLDPENASGSVILSMREANRVLVWDELKEDIKKKLAERKEHDADHDLEHQLVEQVAKGIKAEIPDMMIENAIDENIKNMDYRLQMQGLTMDQYLKYTGMEIGAFRDGFREQADLQVRTDLALEKIVEAEGIAPTAEDLEAEYAKLAETYSMKVEDVKKAVSEESLKRDLAFTKAIDLIKETAVVEEEKPAKKTTRRKAAPKKAKEAAAEAKAEEKAEDAE